MKVTINSQVLAAELRLLNKIVPSKPSYAILSHALFTASGGLRAWATNLDEGLSTYCPATVLMPGSVALPVAKFLEMVEQFPNADVDISLSNSSVTVVCLAFRSRLQTMPVDDFPKQPSIEGKSNTLDAAALRQMINKTRYAVSGTERMYVLQGALLKLDGQAAAMVTTDGHRLSLVVTGREGTDLEIVIPAKTLDLLSSHLTTGSVELVSGERNLFFSFGNRLIVSRTIDATFPKYERVIPRNNDKTAIVPVPALAAALRRILVVSGKTQSVKIDFNSSRAELSSSSVEIGAAVEEVPIQYNSDPLTIPINGSYVLDFLNVSSRQEIKIAMKSADGAILLTDGEDHLGVIMPMRE